jgi:hypothetical protein
MPQHKFSHAQISKPINVLVTLTSVFRLQKLSFFRALIFEQRRSGIIQIIEQIAHTGSAPLSHNILDN